MSPPRIPALTYHRAELLKLWDAWTSQSSCYDSVHPALLTAPVVPLWPLSSVERSRSGWSTSRLTHEFLRAGLCILLISVCTPYPHQWYAHMDKKINKAERKPFSGQVHTDGVFCSSEWQLSWFIPELFSWPT